MNACKCILHTNCRYHRKSQFNGFCTAHLFIKQNRTGRLSSLIDCRDLTCTLCTWVTTGHTGLERSCRKNASYTWMNYRHIYLKVHSKDFHYEISCFIVCFIKHNIVSLFYILSFKSKSLKKWKSKI